MQTQGSSFAEFCQAEAARLVKRSDRVAPDPDLPLTEIDRPRRPDLELVDPGVFRVALCIDGATRRCRPVLTRLRCWISASSLGAPRPPGSDGCTTLYTSACHSRRRSVPRRRPAARAARHCPERVEACHRVVRDPAEYEHHARANHVELIDEDHRHAQLPHRR
jgi:hypothetical protein